MNTKYKGKYRLAAALLAVLLLLSAPTAALAEVFSAIVTSDGMTVYKNAAMTSRLGTLNKHTVVRVLEYSGRAAKIQYAGRTGYASISDMRSVDAVAAKAVVSVPARVYKTPSTTAQSVAVQSGTQVYVLAANERWAVVEKDGAVGYMELNALARADDNWATRAPDATPTPTPTPATAAKVTVKKLPVYKRSSVKSAKLGTLKKGQKVNVIGWNSLWAYIELSGHYGFCATQGLNLPEESPEATASPTPAPTASSTAVTVTASKLPVYKKASTDSAKLGTMRKGQTLNLVSVSGEWAYVELNGRYGYCAASGLDLEDVAIATPTPTVAPTATPSLENAVRGTVIVASLDVYKTASTNSEKLCTLTKGQLVNVLSWTGEWAFIELDGHYGFCKLSGLSRTDATATAMPTATPSTENAVQAVVNVDTVNVYRLAGESSDVVGRLRRSQVVNVLSVSGEWAYIELAGNYGFCRLSALTLDNRPAVPSDYHEGGFTATVIYPAARAYASATTTAQNTGLALGETVNVYAFNSEWACVVNGANYAFVPVKHLSRTAYAAISADGTALQTLLKALLALGYYDGNPATSYNSTAISAIKRFQSACGLDETGVADQTLQRILYGSYAPASPLLSQTLTTGSSGEYVTRLQTRLYALGYLSKAASVDGSYGTTTYNAVGLFQTAARISANGSADSATLKALYSPTAVSRPSGMRAADAASTSGGSTGGVVNPPSSVTLSSTYVTTMPSALRSTTSSYSSSQSNAQKLEHVIYTAQINLGKPYVYGATGPSSFDCSGLTQYSFKKVNVSLKRTAYSQGYDSDYTKVSSVSGLKRGDLVFFNTISDSDLCDHVGIYLGGGCFIHASSGGHKVVVSNIASGYYNRVFSWGRRIL